MSQTKSGAGTIKIKRRPLTADQKRRLEELKKFFAERMADDSGEQERSWEIAKRLLEENHGGYRKLFRD